MGSDIAVAKFHLIDYSTVVFPKGTVPIRRGKFLQFIDENDEVEVVALSPYELSKYHAQILERYCMLNDIVGRYVRMSDDYRVFGGEVTVIGGGHWKIDESNRHLMLTGESTIYGKFDPEGLADKIAAAQALDGFVVFVE